MANEKITAQTEIAQQIMINGVTEQEEREILLAKLNEAFRTLQMEELRKSVAKAQQEPMSVVDAAIFSGIVDANFIHLQIATQAFAEAIDEAVAEHIKTGRLIPVVKDGQIVYVVAKT